MSFMRYDAPCINRLDPKLNGGLTIFGTEVMFQTAVGYMDLYWTRGKSHKKVPPCNINEFLQHHSASFGISRSGKSNGTGRYCEQNVIMNVKQLIIDYYGEYKTLVEISKLKVDVWHV